MAQRVRLRLGENEIEVEGDEKFVEAQVQRFIKRMGGTTTSTPPPDLPAKIVAAAKPTTAPAPAEYYRQKKPKGGTETLLVLAKYLEDFRSQNQFSVTEINRLAAEAKIKDVHTQYFTRAVQQGLTRSVGKSKYALTISGEDAVVSMPSRHHTKNGSDASESPRLPPWSSGHRRSFSAFSHALDRTSSPQFRTDPLFPIRTRRGLRPR
jgi:hypothetical protein